MVLLFEKSDNIKQYLLGSKNKHSCKTEIDRERGGGGGLTCCVITSSDLTT